MTVRALTNDDWVLWRGLRLDALATDPQAFGSTYEREVEFDEATWRQRITSFEDRPIGTLIDEIDGEALGMAGIGFFDSATIPMLVSMWVRPSARRLGCGRRLVDAAVGWAREQSAAEVKLLVVQGNVEATRLYESRGFVAVPPNPQPSDPAIDEVEMRLALTTTKVATEATAP